MKSRRVKLGRRTRKRHRPRKQSQTRMQRGGSQIHHLVREGDLAGVRAEIAKGQVDINKVDIAADNNELDEYGENINGISHVRRDGYGETPLTLAAQKGYLEIVKVLIAAKADVNKTNKNGLTPLIFATLNGHLEIVKALIAANADVNIGDPLWNAVNKGHLEIVKALIAAKADVNSTDDEGYTPLIVAASKGHLDMVKALIAAGADVNKTNNYGYTPLSVAASNGHLKIAMLLQAAGAKVGPKETELLRKINPDDLAAAVAESALGRRGNVTRAYYLSREYPTNGNSGSAYLEKGGRRKTVSKRR